VLLMALAVVGIGLFIAAVYLADFVSRRIALHGAAMPDEAEPLPEPAPAMAVERERVPIGRPLSVKS